MFWADLYAHDVWQKEQPKTLNSPPPPQLTKENFDVIRWTIIRHQGPGLPFVAFARHVSDSKLCLLAPKPS